VAELVFDDARNRLDLFDLGHVQRVRLDLRLGGLHDARAASASADSRATDQDFHALPAERARRSRPFRASSKTSSATSTS